MSTITEIQVRFTGGTYQTSTVKKLRASCTSDARTAAQRLGEKLYGNSFFSVEEVTHEGAPVGASTWRIHADAVEQAWCWQSGLIEFGESMPADGKDGGGPIKIAHGPARALRATIGTLAREGWGNCAGKYLVPGVPEANGPIARVDALTKWHQWCSKRDGRPGTFGVVFGGLGHIVAHGVRKAMSHGAGSLA